MTAAAIAHDILRRGYKPVPVPVGKKNPVLTEWQKLDVTPANVDHYFNGGDKNVGAILGPRSSGLADADLDCREAVALAPHFLPRTGSIYGRAGKRRSHYLYKCPDPPPKASVQLKDETKAMIVELRVGGGGKGAQSIWPGSLHTSGERYEWDEDGEPVSTSFEALREAATKIAIGTIIARHWPERSRHDAALRVGGFLARCGWTAEAIGEFMVVIQTVAGVADPEHIETAQLARVGPTYMRDVLGRIAHWYKLDLRRNQWVQINPPNETAETVLARAGEWAFPTIAGIINTPTLRPDGTILDEAGFDPATRLLLIDPPKMAPIPDEPTMKDARRELARLKLLIRGFPFVDMVARSVMLSAIITPVARGGFTVVPMHTVDAPVAGAGKSYGLDVVSMIATGERMPVVAAGPDAEESEKRLGSALLAGQPLICVDNISGVLRGDALCQYIERPRPQVRILGKSELITVETRGTSLFANGNNLVIVGDLCRRVVRARLDPRMEDPELRVFKTNPLALIAADRGAYIRAALVICRAYIAAGRPDPRRRLASFEGWSDTVRSALVWLGEADPVISMTSAKAEDPERATFRDLLRVWADTIGTGSTNSKTLKAVVAMALEKTTAGGYAEPTFVWPELNAALQAAVNGDRYRPLSAASLGYWLRNHKDAIVGSHRFRYSERSNVGYWWVEKIGATTDHADAAEAAEEQPF